VTLTARFLAGTALCLLAAPASAQQSEASPANRPAQSADRQQPGTETVVVTGSNQGVRPSVDRLSYSVANDLQTATGSVSDALRNVPGVEVDPQGNVSLRGDPNVTILIDGRPSALFRGEGRADALQNLGADQVDRVEVITNPSAALSPEGTGGVINLVTKKTRRAGKSGTVRASVGADGRWNGSVSGAYTGQKLTVSANAGYRRNGGEFTDRRVRERLDPDTQAVLDTTRFSTLSNQEGGGFANARLGVDYDPDASDRYSLEASYFRFGLEPEGVTTLDTRTGAGQVTRSTERLFENAFYNENRSLRTSFRRKFSGTEHEFTADLTFEQFANFNETDLRERSLVPVGDDAFEASRNEIDRDDQRLKLEYKRPLGDDRKLLVGYEGHLSEADFSFMRLRGASRAGLTPDPRFSNQFAFDQDVHAWYGTYERPYGEKLRAQFGLRLEQVETAARSLTDLPPDSPVEDFEPRQTNAYFRAYPTLNLGYDLDENRTVRAGYSRRIQRPQALDVNPFPVFVDEQTFRTGNPALDPEVTDSFEGAFQYRKGQTFYLATLFYRQAGGGVTDVLIPPQTTGGFFELTRENLSESRRAGLELSANGRFTPKLTYSVGLNAARVEIDPLPGTPLATSRSGTAVGGRVNVNWTPTDRDFVQISGFMQGEQLQAQGVREPTGILNVGYRRKIDDRLSLVFTAVNVLDTFKQKVRIDTPNLRESVETRFLPPVVFVGLIWNFGDTNARRRPEPAFDFDAGGGVGPG
jgi:outer membrane receptor protein involved in Fe transport